MECVVYGVGSPYVYDVAEILARLSWAVRGWVANIDDGSVPSDLTPVVPLADMPREWTSLPVVFPLITPGHRQALEREARGLGFQHFPAVVDPTATIASRSTVGDGALINAGVVVGARSAIGRFASVNRSASVGHDVVIRDYASLGPGSVLCGGAEVAAGAFVGAGAVLAPNTRVGANATVGAGAVVVKDVPERAVAVGNPARVVREGVLGYNDVTVTAEG